mmetsp:Transcript_32650/g.96216  ORF Transcript_32650/g.96216 Transcript_32650/m.96216 type:complete len:464 (-) Transcript_32650:949-2340(-)
MNLTVNTNANASTSTSAASEHREPEQQPARGDSSRCCSPSSSSLASPTSGSPGRTRRGGRGGRGKNRHNNSNNNNHNRHSSPRSVAAPPSPSSFFFGGDNHVSSPSSPSSSPLSPRPNAPPPSPGHLAKYSRRANPRVPPSPPHDAPMTKADLYFAMDCEMVGVGPGGSGSALARVVLVNYDEEVVLDQYVRVAEPVTDYRTFVSGVTAADLADGAATAPVSFDDCRARVREILHGKILVGHGLASDLAALGMSHPWRDVRDTAKYAPFMRRVHSRDTRQDVLLPSKLRDLVWDRCRMQIQHLGESHDPAEDAIAALRLYKSARKEWEGDMIRQVKAARELEEASVRRAARRQQRVMARQQQQQHHQPRGPVQDGRLRRRWQTPPRPSCVNLHLDAHDVRHLPAVGPRPGVSLVEHPRPVLAERSDVRRYQFQHQGRGVRRRRTGRHCHRHPRYEPSRRGRPK